MNTPLVSVIMPAYNAATTIRESIASVLAQSHRELELLVVDDGSTDHTRQIVQEVKDSRVRLIELERQSGVSAARNVGVERSSGAYLKYLDSDDLINGGAVEAQLAIMSRCSELTLCTSAWGRFYENPEDLKVVEAPDWQDLDPMSFLELSLGGGGTMPVMTWLLHRTLHELAGPWPVGAQLFEDTEYGTRLALAADQVRFCREAMGLYRTKQTGTLSSARDFSSYARGMQCFDRICAAVLQKRDAPDTRAFLANFYRRYTIQVTGISAELASRAEARVAELGGSKLEPGGGPIFMVLRRLFGWQKALWLKRWFR
jgi:glycosyltransferase involved in cell wall biosynthesis